MTFCATCGKQMPCGVTHKKGRGKATARSRDWALKHSGKITNAPLSNGRSDWTLFGPAKNHKVFPGTVTASLGTVVKAQEKGNYYSINLYELFKSLRESNVTIYGVIFRFCLDHDSGDFGIIKGFDLTKPTPPNPLSRRKFAKSVAMGVQLLAPANTTSRSVDEDVFLVFRYASDFTKDTIIWVRDLYIQHSLPQKIEIPEGVLLSEKLPAVNPSDG